jgi:SAM-dependent methyltransferase
MGATWEEAVLWLRQQPDAGDLVRDAYYDDPLSAAAERYWTSEEWRAVRALIGGRSGKALDVGAGRGIASYALARDGFEVTAFEPDPSGIVGAGAIRSLAGEAGLAIEVVQDMSEALPFPDASFDLIFARAVLHHVGSLESAMREYARVLKPGGLFLAIREHVISRDEDLEAFFKVHPLHHRYGGEKAFRLSQYVQAIERSGLKLVRVLKPLRSVVNYAPYSKADLHKEMGSRLARVPGLGFALPKMLGLPLLGSALLALIERFDHRPGRLYSFVAVRGA